MVSLQEPLFCGVKGDKAPFLTGGLSHSMLFLCHVSLERSLSAYRTISPNAGITGKISFFSSEDRQVYLQWLVERAEDYPWSSAAAHCGLVTVPVLSPITIDHMLTTAGWSDWLAGDDGDEMLWANRGTGYLLLGLYSDSKARAPLG